MSRPLWLVPGFCLLAAAVPAHGQPQHHHHHHHPGGYPNWYTPGYPTYVSPAPTVIAAPAMQNALPYTGPGVTIVLEEEEGGSVTYSIDGRESSTIQAGQAQTLASKGKYEIRFSRGRTEDGRDFGEARYTITEGNYHFTVTDRGWELFRDREQPNLVATRPSSPSGIRTNVLPRKP